MSRRFRVTLANLRKTFRHEIKDLFVQVLLLAQTAGYLQMGNISLDGSKLHAKLEQRSDGLPLYARLWDREGVVG